MAIYKQGLRVKKREKLCCPQGIEESSKCLNFFYCSRDQIPVNSVGRVTVCLIDGTEETLSHGDVVPSDINGFVLLDPNSLRMKYVPGKPPVDIAEAVSSMIQSLDVVTAESARAIAKAAFIACFDENVNKDLISGYVAKCLLESGLPTAGQITEQINQAVNEVDIPSAEYIRSLIDQFQRSEDAIRLIIQGEISEAGILSESNVNALAKIVATSCFSELISEYCTKAEIGSLITAAFDTAGILGEQEIRLIAKQESLSSINEYPFKELVLNCIADAGISSVTQIQQIASDEAQIAVNALSIPSQPLIESWSKAVALVCIQAELGNQYLPSQEELVALIKQTTFDCLKELINLETQVSICYEYGGDTYTQDASGKITIHDCIKADGYNGSCEPAVYSPDEGCRVIPYTGPTAEEIREASLQGLSESFCIKDVSVDHNQLTGQFSFSITDHCGTQSDTTILPTSTGNGDGGITLLQAQAVVETYIDSNQQRFCNDAIRPAFDPVTRQFTIEIDDYCGTRSGSVVIPGTDAGSGICNSDFVFSLNGTMLTGSVTDECGTQSDQIDLASLGNGGESQCLSGASLTYTGSTLALQIEQENCTATLASVVLPIDPNGNLVECCNTSFDPISFDADTCIITATLNQSAGDPVSLDIPLADFISSETVTDVDGCSQYNVLRIGNKELFRAPVYEPMEAACVRMCADGYTGNQTVGPIEGIDVVITIEDIGLTYLLEAGNTFDLFAETGQNLADYTGPIDICVSDVCDNDAFRELQTITANPSHKNC